VGLTRRARAAAASSLCTVSTKARVDTWGRTVSRGLLVAELLLDKRMLQDVAKKKW